jgi:hypothetical protein
MSDSTKILNKFILAPAFSAGVGTAVFMAIYGNQGLLKMGPVTMSPAYVFGASIAAGDVAGTLITDAISETNQVAALDTAQKMLIKPMVTGATTLGVISLLVAPPRDLMAAGKIFGLGAGANIGGGYMHEIVMSVAP